MNNSRKGAKWVPYFLTIITLCVIIVLRLIGIIKDTQAALILFSIAIGIGIILVTLKTLVTRVEANKSEELVRLNSRIARPLVAELKGISKKLNTNVDVISQKLGLIPDTQDNSSTMSGHELLRYIYSKEQLKSLEGSVPPGLNIYIISTLFIFEEEIRDIIACNLRKAVKYTYLIPEKEFNAVPPQNDYFEMLANWYLDFSCFLSSKELCEQLLEIKKDYDKQESRETSIDVSEDDHPDQPTPLTLEQETAMQETQEVQPDVKYDGRWSQDYIDLLNRAVAYWQRDAEEQDPAELLEMKGECQNMFKGLINTYTEDDKAFPVTIAAYEVDYRKWEAIIKLPTVSKEPDTTYSLKITDDRKNGFVAFIESTYFKHAKPRNADIPYSIIFKRAEEMTRLGINPHAVE